MGPIALDSLKTFLKSGLRYLNDGKSPLTPFPVIVNSHKYVDQHEDLNAMRIKNPNNGKSGQTRTKKSFLESSKHINRPISKINNSRLPFATDAAISRAIEKAVRTVDSVMNE